MLEMIKKKKNSKFVKKSNMLSIGLISCQHDKRKVHDQLVMARKTTKQADMQSTQTLSEHIAQGPQAIEA